MVDQEVNIGVTRNYEIDITEINGENEQFNAEIESLQINATNYDTKSELLNGHD